MSLEKFYCLSELLNKLDEDGESRGCLIGQSDENSWKLYTYLGNRQVLELYNGQVQEETFKYLAENLDELKVSSLVSTSNAIDLDDEELKSNENLTFYKYEVNICQVEDGLKLIETIKHNLNELANLENGDIILFKRQYYDHTAILLNKNDMTIIHRSGDFDNLNGWNVESIEQILIDPDNKNDAFIKINQLMTTANESMIENGNKTFEDKAPEGANRNSNEETLRIAMERLGEKGYTALNKNCQHFVAECQFNTPFCPEFDKFKNMILEQAALTPEFEKIRKIVAKLNLEDLEDSESSESSED